MTKSRKQRLLCSCVCFSCALQLMLPPVSQGQLPAFLGAVGQGASATGGRGGDVYHVTTLEDYPSIVDPIEGSLRHGLETANGPRTCGFGIGGRSELARPMRVASSNLTIAGQTAPGPGITLWGYPLIVDGADDTVIRYLRVRMGDFNAAVPDENGEPIPGQGNGNMNLIDVDADALTVTRSERVIVDHVSASWSFDEALSVTESKDITVQQSLIGESLHDSFHRKGPHGDGSLIRALLTPEEQAAGEGGYTFSHNLFAHHFERNPGVGAHGSEGPRLVDVNFVNNVVYNWGRRPSHRVDGGEARMNFVGNYFISGPDTTTPFVFSDDHGVQGETLLYQTGNFRDFDQDDVHNGDEIDTPQEEIDNFINFDSPDDFRIADPFNFGDSILPDAHDAEDAYEKILRTVGASLSRDAIDARHIRNLEERSGSIIDSQDDVGGLDDILAIPVVERSPDFDTDQDGMPDPFEDWLGLDPNDPADRNDVGLSDIGLTNLEFYLQTLLFPPDYNFNERVDAADYTVFRDNFGRVGDGVPGDGNRDGVISAADYNAWRDNFGQTFANAVPEPSSIAMLLAATILAWLRRRR